VLVCTTIWIPSNYLYETLTLKYPDFRQTKTRLLYTFLGFILITSVVHFIDCYFICSIVLKQPFWENFLQNYKITLFVTGVVYIIHEAIFFYNNWKKALLYSEQLKKEHAQAQFESLRNQVNPHFLFNSLNTLSAIIPMDADRAVDFVHKLSNSYRYLLKMRESELVCLAEELEFANAYLFMIKARYGENIQIEMADNSTDKTLMLLPASLQILLENCIKHNVISKDRPLLVQVKIDDDKIEVQNNLQPKLAKDPSTGLGLENIKKRYQLLSDRQMQWQQTEVTFWVQLPLLKISE
jgi:two-component system, LytTR family, sensor kinase